MNTDQNSAADIKALKPTSAFIGASWVALLLGAVAYFIGLFNADMELNEKGYYFLVFVFGLFGVVSLQKTVRDRNEGIPVTGIYYGIAWVAVGISLAMLGIGLWNADGLLRSEKGFYAMAFALSLFAAVAVQKNIRDLAQFNRAEESEREDDAAGRAQGFPLPSSAGEPVDKA